MIVWLNGSLIESNEARIDPAERGFLLGEGLFETIAVRAGAALRVDDHLQRLAEGMALVGFARPTYDLAGAIDAVRSANNLSEGCLRLTVSRGPAARGLLAPDQAPPTVLVTGVSCPVGDGIPLTAIIATTTRRNEFSPLSRIKSVNYLDGILARQEAAAAGADEAILVNTRGLVVETTIANLFLVLDGVARTPAVEAGALPGIMRAEILSRLDALQGTVTVDDLGNASEVFVTNALGVRPIVRIDGHSVGDGRPGPVTASLSNLP